VSRERALVAAAEGTRAQTKFHVIKELSRSRLIEDPLYSGFFHRPARRPLFRSEEREKKGKKRENADRHTHTHTGTSVIGVNGPTR